MLIGREELVSFGKIRPELFSSRPPWRRLQVVISILYMPKSGIMDSPRLLEFLQYFSWTQAGLPAALAQRAEQVAQMQVASEWAAGGMQARRAAWPAAAVWPAASSPPPCCCTCTPPCQPPPWLRCLSLQGSVMQLVGHVKEEFAHGRAKFAGLPDAKTTRELLQQEPMFCMETGG